MTPRGAGTTCTGADGGCGSVTTGSWQGTTSGAFRCLCDE